MNNAEKLLAYRQEVAVLLDRINEIETNLKMSIDDKLVEIKDIRKRLKTISEAIDIIQKDIKLAAYKIN